MRARRVSAEPKDPAQRGGRRGRTSRGPATVDLEDCPGPAGLGSHCQFHQRFFSPTSARWLAAGIGTCVYAFICTQRHRFPRTKRRRGDYQREGKDIQEEGKS